ncbi:MAG: alpha/beta hydrolase [Proteobacteria bacterium]|nr:alpha/beta hydrolase [Pseudomonadota bacterium]MBS0421650.1 alpha/beta hydrolase [Pseudomonadota bacterium]
MTHEARNDLDPQIRLFVERMGAAWREYPSLNSVPLAEARRIADQVRGRFTPGGPQMVVTTERMVDWYQGRVRVRIYEARTGKDRPAFLYLHGGGWTLFSLDTHDRIMREYAARSGAVVIGVDYSLSPEVRFPRAIDETLAVVRWLQREGPTLGINPNRLALGGDSAGAAMTVSVGLKLRDWGEPGTLRAMVLNYGCFDAGCASESFKRYGQGGYLWDPGEMQAFWSNYLGNTDPLDPLAAPLHADVRGLPPAFLAIPECDVMHDESVAMGNKLRAAGVPAQTVIYPGATHSFLEAVSMARVADRAFDETARWLEDMLI